DLTIYGSSQAAVRDVTLVGSHTGPIPGPLFIDPTREKITFKATSSYLVSLAHSSDILPDDNYTATLISGGLGGTGGNGFIDMLGAGLDGAFNGGHANYVNTFAVHSQGTPRLGPPDFARGSH